VLSRVALSGTGGTPSASQKGATVFLDAPIDASPSPRRFTYTCPTSQVFAFSATCRWLPV